MIAYNNKQSDHLSIRAKARAALDNNLISKEEYAAIENAYPVVLYMPNMFIRIGLFILTVVVVMMGFGLLCLLTSVSSEEGFAVLAAFFSVVLYVVLEIVIRRNNHYRSGLDDALLWLSAGFMVTTFYLFFPDISPLGQAVFMFMLTAWATLRFADSIMSGLIFISLIAIVFYSVLPLGSVAKIVMPFLLMLFSFLIYRLIKQYDNNIRLRHYQSCFLVTETLALLTLYFAVNFFVVREVGNELFDLHLKAGSSITGGWFFWSMSVLIPPVYILRGLQKKDIVLLRTGLLLIAATVFTIHYYYPFASIEVSMTVAGIIMIGAAYLITKYLKTPKYGITSKEANDPRLPGMLQLEALVIAEAFHQVPGSAPTKHPEFGGGSGGGGGATGQY